ncbi:MAG: GAF domain-containing protein [Candidatus Omnitrophica bacterium]|nr:GAF domain-containing protein [Candidatus Omnitrophota bacterium]
MIEHKKVIDNISIGVSLVSPEGEPLYINKQMKKWFSGRGFPQEPTCHNIFSNFSKDSNAVCPTCAALSSKKTQGTLIKISLGGTDTVYKMISSPVKNKEGRTIAVIETIEDLTKIDRQEEKIRHNYLTQATINSLLCFSLENISLEEFLKCALNVVLSAPLFSSLGMGAIFLVEHEPQVLMMKAQSRLPEALQKEYRRVPFGKGVCGRAASLGDFQFDDGFKEGFIAKHKIKGSYARYCSPIIYAGNVVGVMEVCLEKGHKRERKEEEFLKMITTTLAGVIQRKRGEERLSQINECLLNLGADSLENIQRLVALCGNILRTTSAFYNRLNPKEDTYCSLARYNPPVGYIIEGKYSRSICYDVINKRGEEPLVVYDLPHSFYVGKDSFCSLYQFRTYIGQTVKCRGKHAGVVCGAYKNESLLGSEDKKFLGIIASAIGIEEERIKANEELRQSSEKLKLAQHGLVQSEKLAALGRFSSGIAHEVKNPLGIILGGTEYLEKKLQSKDKDIKIALEKIKESTLRADTIVRNLVKFAMPSEIKKEKIHPRDLVNDALSLLKYRSSLINVDIVAEFSKEDIRIEVDKNQLNQVLFNILINAIDAMPKGGIIKIKTYKAPGAEFSKAEPVCVIEIVDRGEGIPKENFSRLFEPFFTTKRDKKGTGLGLVMSKTIVENHRGFLLVDSEPGKGTRVRVILPIL